MSAVPPEAAHGRPDSDPDRPRAGASRPPLPAAREAAARALPPEPDPAGVAPSGVGVVNLANGLTVLRLLLVPVFLVMLFVDRGGSTAWRIGAWAVFAVAAFTDRIDGNVARSRNLVTEFGKLADPLADKALTGGALIGLSALNELPWWVTIVVLAREIGVTLLRFWVIRIGVMPASRGGKLKTLLLAVAIGLYVLPLSGPLGTLRAVIMGAAVVVAVATGIDYVGRATALRRGRPRSPEGPPGAR